MGDFAWRSRFELTDAHGVMVVTYAIGDVDSEMMNARYLEDS